MTAQSYDDFLKAKVKIAPTFTFEVSHRAFHARLKDHQRAIARWAVRGGRRAIFTAFGLGKTGMQLETLRVTLESVGGIGLVIAPLGVRIEFMREAALLGYYGNGEGAPVDEPSRTVTTRDRFGLIAADAYPAEDAGGVFLPLPPEMTKRALQVAEFLRRHGAWDGGEFVTVTIAGVLYIVVDIGMRMLTSRELARAQGFPDTYILAAPFAGGFLPDTDQRHKIGNSVCPPMARALVRANYRPALVARAEPPAPYFLEAAE